MSALTQPALAILLDRLFAELDASEDALRRKWKAFPRSNEPLIVLTTFSSTDV